MQLLHLTSWDGFTTYKAESSNSNIVSYTRRRQDCLLYLCTDIPDFQLDTECRRKLKNFFLDCGDDRSQLLLFMHFGRSRRQYRLYGCVRCYEIALWSMPGAQRRGHGYYEYSREREDYRPDRLRDLTKRSWEMNQLHYSEYSVPPWLTLYDVLSHAQETLRQFCDQFDRSTRDELAEVLFANLSTWPRRDLWALLLDASVGREFLERHLKHLQKKFPSYSATTDSSRLIVKLKLTQWETFQDIHHPLIALYWTCSYSFGFWGLWNPQHSDGMRSEEMPLYVSFLQGQLVKALQPPFAVTFGLLKYFFPKDGEEMRELMLSALTRGPQEEDKATYQFERLDWQRSHDVNCTVTEVQIV